MPYALLAILVWLLDRGSKVWVMKNVALWYSRPLLGNLLRLTHVRNTGAAFGLLHNQVPLLSMVTLFELVVLYLFRQQINSLRIWGRLGATLIVAGALGNFYDRLVYGHVVDFLELPYWPVFNLADSAIVVGVALLVMGVWMLDRREPSAHS
jgi:signal peptidase II